MASEALKTRAQVKKRKPTYKNAQSHQFPKLREVKWRLPKGLGHKVRRGRRGKPTMPEVGFGSPKEVKFLNKDGLKEVIVSNVSELKKVNPKTEIVMIGSKVGAKKRLAILHEVKKLNLKVSNVKKVDETIKALTKVKKEPAKKETKVSAKKEVASEKKEETKTTPVKAEEVKSEKTAVPKKETKQGGKKE